MREPLPPNVEGGTGTYGSRGKLIDRLMGDRRIREAARREIDTLAERSTPPDPPLVELPPAVPETPRTRSSGRRLSGIRPRPAR